LKVFIIHGTNGNSKENWFPWLKEELEKTNIETIVPDFPTGDMQSLSSWLESFQPYIGRIDGDCIFVGHSLGPAFILSVLEQIDTRIRAAFLVAPFVSKLGIEQFDKSNKTFVEKEFNWEKIKTNCTDFTVYASDNDPYVSLERSRFVADHTDAKFKVVHGAGHFNAAAGYTKFKQLLEDIKSALQ
jgi:predicted alpha/beta hydrolase family esterase